jgi:hypothetical protein
MGVRKETINNAESDLLLLTDESSYSEPTYEYGGIIYGTGSGFYGAFSEGPHPFQTLD